MIAELKDEVIQKSSQIEFYKNKFEKKELELNFYKKILGPFYGNIFKKRYKEYKSLIGTEMEKDMLKPVRNLELEIFKRKDSFSSRFFILTNYSDSSFKLMILGDQIRRKLKIIYH